MYGGVRQLTLLSSPSYSFLPTSNDITPLYTVSSEQRIKPNMMTLGLGFKDVGAYEIWVFKEWETKCILEDSCHHDGAIYKLKAVRRNELCCRCTCSIAAWPTKCGIWEMRTSCSKLCGDLWKLKFNGVCKWVVRSLRACIYITKGSLTKEKMGEGVQYPGLNHSNFLFSLSLFAFYLDQSTTEEAVFGLTLTEGRQEARSERIVWQELQILACCLPKNGKSLLADSLS